MYVMMDWVPNHSSWDNNLADEHPDWYVRDSTGGFVSPYDWTDVIQFDWSNEGLHKYMKEALLYWVEELDVDGFRVDHPHVTPADFWLEARLAMEKIKTLLRLAENEQRVEIFENRFDINYSWELHHLMNRVAQGEETAQELHRAILQDENRYPKYAYRLRFITNHDENSWAGTIEERMGEAHEAFAVFMYTIPGVPLIYNGQEAGLNKRLEFFDRDPIEWHDSYLRDFYTSLNSLKKDNKALNNGASGGSFRALNISGDQEVYGYIREKDDNIVITVINFDDNAAEFTVNTNISAEYSDYFSGDTISIGNNNTLLLEGWSYLVLTAL
jgi:cyclomaltodextrinase